MNSTARGEDTYEGLLIINRVSQSSYGDYVCRATNKMGVKRTIIKLQPKAKPERPDNLKSTMSTYDTITLSWQPGFDGGFTDTRYQVQYRHGNELQPHYFDCEGNTESCNITGKQKQINFKKSCRNYCKIIMVKILLARSLVNKQLYVSIYFCRMNDYP